MARRRTDPVTWANGASLSNWTWFGAEAPNSLVLPSGMEGDQVAFMGTESGADGNADAAGAVGLLDLTAGKVVLPIPAGGGRLVFVPDALRCQGWIALRAETAAGVAQVQSAPRTGAWLRAVD